MNSSKRRRLLRDRIELGEYTPKTGLLLPAERVGLKNTKGFYKQLMAAIASDVHQRPHLLHRLRGTEKVPPQKTSNP